MNIALITYDEDLKNKLTNALAGNIIRTYIDSISMLKDLEEFNPDIVIYDASTGDFAVEDLKFLISREKVKNKKFKILYSKLNPIDKENLDKEDIDFYVKEEDIESLVKDVQSESVEEAPELQTPQTPSSPEDIELFYTEKEQSENIPGFENMFSQLTPEELESFEEKESFQAKPELPLEEQSYGETTNFIEEPQEVKLPEPKVSESVINISLDIEDIKKGIVMIAVDRLVENLKNEPEIKELTDNIARDFVSRIDEELDKLKEEIRNEVKENMYPKVEEEIKAIIKQDLREYVAEITSKIVKEKLDQIFNK